MAKVQLRRQAVVSYSRDKVLSETEERSVALETTSMPFMVRITTCAGKQVGAAMPVCNCLYGHVVALTATQL